MYTTTLNFFNHVYKYDQIKKERVTPETFFYQDGQQNRQIQSPSNVPAPTYWFLLCIPSQSVQVSAFCHLSAIQVTGSPSSVLSLHLKKNRCRCHADDTAHGTRAIKWIMVCKLNQTQRRAQCFDMNFRILTHPYTMQLCSYCFPINWNIIKMLNRFNLLNEDNKKKNKVKWKVYCQQILDTIINE